jgi:hypothetical protein
MMSCANHPIFCLPFPPAVLLIFDLAIRLAKPAASRIITISIDVTHPPATKPLNRKSTSHLPEITRTHLISMRSKLEGRSHLHIPGHAIIQAINVNHATLLPFTVDHLGGLGPIAIPFLFHPSRSPITHSPPLTAGMLNLTNEHSLFTYHRAVDSTNLHIADQRSSHPHLEDQ